MLLLMPLLSAAAGFWLPDQMAAAAAPIVPEGAEH